MIAIKYKNNDIIRNLISQCGNINYQNVSGETALMIASKFNNIQAVQLLLKRKAKVEFKNIYGEDAIKLANQENTDLLNLLVTYKSTQESSSSTKNVLVKQNTLKDIVKK